METATRFDQLRCPVHIEQRPTKLRSAMHADEVSTWSECKSRHPVAPPAHTGRSQRFRQDRMEEQSTLFERDLETRKIRCDRVVVRTAGIREKVLDEFHKRLTG